MIELSVLKFTGQATKFVGIERREFLETVGVYDVTIFGETAEDVEAFIFNKETCMTREILIKRTIENLTKLPDYKLKEVSDFAEFLLSRIDNQLMTDSIQQIVSESKTFKFLEVEEDLYTVSDLKSKI